MAAESSLAREPSGTAATPRAAGEVGAEAAEVRQWEPVLSLPCELMVDLPLPGFRIADLLKLRMGSVINAHWPVGHDVPLRLNGELMGWIEFEVVGDHLAVRLTELA